MSQPFAVFDIDGTLIRWQLYHAIADALAKRGHIDAKTYQTIYDARMLWKRRTHEESFKAYETELVRSYDKILQKLTVSQFEEASQAVFNEYKEQVYTYTRKLIKQLKADGYKLFAISGSQNEIVAHIADYYGFDDYIGTIYEREGEHFTGKRQATVFGKGELLKNLMIKHDIKSAGSLAIGDSMSDVSMFELVETQIIFNPERKLFDYAKKQRWKIVVERKNMVYELEQKNGQYQLV